MSSSLDFEQTVSHLHELIGQHVSVTFHNYDLPDRQVFAGFRGQLGHAAKPVVADLHDTSGGHRADAFYVGDSAHDHSWFTIDERTFTAADFASGKAGAADEALMVDIEGLHIVIAVDPRG